AHQVAVGADPSACAAQVPVEVPFFLGQQEQRLAQEQGAFDRIAAQVRGAKGEGFAAVPVERNELEVLEHVIGAVAGAGRGGRLGPLAPGRPAARDRGDQEHDDQRAAPGHWPAPAISVASSPRAARSRSQNSRAAPSPPRWTDRQWTWPRMAGCASAGAAARPAAASTARSVRSSPMNATASAARPRRVRRASTQASLSLTRVCTPIPSSRARSSAAGLARAVTSATVTPARESSDSPRPSWTWNALISVPKLELYRRPSVRVPSTSKQAR